MGVLLKYRQGSFRREERLDFEDVAIVRAGELMHPGSGCGPFEITDEQGRRLKSDMQIKNAFKLLWQECYGQTNVT